MFTRIDHIMLCVPELNRGIEQFRSLGFNVDPGGVHPGQGTHNAIAFNEVDYIELLAIRDAAEAAAGGPASMSGSLQAFVDAGGGIRYVIVQSDDLAGDVAAMRSRDVDVGEAIDGARVTPSGQTLRWKCARLGSRNPLPVFFIQHLTPVATRRGREAGSHPNGVHALERVYIATDDVNAAAALYARVLGMAQPAVQRGTVIMSDMAVFQLGPTGLALAQPYAPGPGADALARRGSGPFQALYRTASMQAAASWMTAHGVPPLPRGVRNTGEQAMLATPDLAGGAYIGFVGPE